jgi:hypothetical protein
MRGKDELGMMEDEILLRCWLCCFHTSVFILHPSNELAVHPELTDGVGSRAAVKATARRPDGTWNIELTVAVFRPWRGSQATIASDPTFIAAPPFVRPRRRRDGEFSPAVAGCW